MIVDSHCHLYDIKNFSPVENILPVISGYSHSTNLKTIEIAKKYNYPFCIGIAPQTVLKEGMDKLDLWVSTIKRSKPNAIGEIGLDYHWAKTDEQKKLQGKCFNEMIALAESMKLPIVLHSRETTNICLDMLEEAKFKGKVMLHFFSGIVEDALRTVSIGGFVSFPPVGSKSRKDTLLKIPLESILVETDAPFVGRNISDVSDSIKYVAGVKNSDFDTVADQTAKNAFGFFNIR
ncbi:MAG: TatD family hydrolase [Candidatus Micrarchaeota archaeon]